MLHLIHRLFPKFMAEQEDEMKSLLLSHFRLMIKIMSAIDVYTITRGIYDMFNKMHRVSKKNSFLLDINNDCMDYMRENLQKIMEKKITHENEIEWPNMILLKKYFEDFLYKPGGIQKWSNVDNKNDIDPLLMEIYNVNAPIRYTMDADENWPSLLKIDQTSSKDQLEDFYLFHKYHNNHEKIKLDAISDQYREVTDADLFMSSWEL